MHESICFTAFTRQWFPEFSDKEMETIKKSLEKQMANKIEKQRKAIKMFAVKKEKSPNPPKPVVKKEKPSQGYIDVYPKRPVHPHTQRPSEVSSGHISTINMKPGSQNIQQSRDIQPSRSIPGPQSRNIQQKRDVQPSHMSVTRDQATPNVKVPSQSVPPSSVMPSHEMQLQLGNLTTQSLTVIDRNIKAEYDVATQLVKEGNIFDTSDNGEKKTFKRKLFNPFTPSTQPAPQIIIKPQYQSLSNNKFVGKVAKERNSKKSCRPKGGVRFEDEEDKRAPKSPTRGGDLKDTPMSSKRVEDPNVAFENDAVKEKGEGVDVDNLKDTIESQDGKPQDEEKGM